MSHTRGGKLAKAQRRMRAADRERANKQFFDHIKDFTAEERLILAIFGGHEICKECGNDNKLVGADCMTPACKAARKETSIFYEAVTQDQVRFLNGGVLEAGVDY